jgi:hypothetical protein
MTSPYAALPPERFWRSGVAGAASGDFPGLYTPRFPIGPGMRIATAGSCFAQHVGNHLRLAGFSVLDAEPPPPGLDAEAARRFGFNLYSARHGNIYTVRQLLQLAREAFGEFTPGDAIWQRTGRWVDALRPTVEPFGLPSAEAVRQHRAQHLAAVRSVLQSADLLVFTMGLVEAWVHRPSGTVYPTAPGVVADSDAPGDIALHCFDFLEILGDFEAFRALVRRLNPGIRVLLTVSPVPLTATATEDHVLVATTEAKATLRAVAGQLRRQHADIDYFPSYEIIAGHPSRGRYYAANLREVTAEGVACVMRHFAAAVGPVAVAAAPAEAPSPDADAAAEAVVCEEALLEAFGEAGGDHG